MVLLASGGHCLLAIARDISDFLLLGTGLDDSPGDAFDKVGLACTRDIHVCMHPYMCVCCDLCALLCVCVCVCLCVLSLIHI